MVYESFLLPPPCSYYYYYYYYDVVLATSPPWVSDNTSTTGKTAHRRSRSLKFVGATQMASPYERIYVDASIGVSPADMLAPTSVVKQHIARGLLKYNPKYEGVLLAYDKVKIQPRGQVQWDMSHIVTQYSFEGLIFRPKVGDILTGTVNNLKNNHIGLKADGIIPTSIPSHAIPKGYVFDDETSTWKETGEGKVGKIEYEDKVLFRIDIINTANGVLTLIGTLMMPDSLEREQGLVPTINGTTMRAPHTGFGKSKVEKLDDDDDDVLDMPEGLTFDVDSEEEDAEETNDNSISGKKRPLRDLDSTSDDEEGKKKKKKKKNKSEKKKKKKKEKKRKKSM